MSEISPPIPAYPFRAGRLANNQPGVGIDAETGLAYDLSDGPNRGRLYLVYTDRANVNPATTGTTIDVVYSDLDGRTTASWSSPVSVTGGGNGNSEFFPRIAVDDSDSDPGTVAVSWLDARNDPNDQAVEEFAAVSVDGGDDFSANEQIAAAPSDAVAIVDPNQFGDYMGLTFYGGSFYPIWADNSNSTGDNPNPNNPTPALAQFKSSSNIYTARVTLLRRRHVHRERSRAAGLDADVSRRRRNPRRDTHRRPDGERPELRQLQRSGHHGPGLLGHSGQWRQGFWRPRLCPAGPSS